MYVFFGFILFIVFLFLLGLVIGLCGYDTTRKPSRRTSLSNCGGVLLMTGAFVVLFFGAFFMVITSFTFIIGGPIDRLACYPLLSGELFSETSDYNLGNFVYGDPTIPLTLKGILEECANNNSIYSALRLSNLINISQYEDLTIQIPGVYDRFANITVEFDEVVVLNSRSRQTLMDFISSSRSVNFETFTDELNKRLIVDADMNSNSLRFLIAALHTDANLTVEHEMKLQDVITNLEDIENNILDPLLLEATALKTEIDQFMGATVDIDDNVQMTIDAAGTAQDAINNGTEGVLQSVVTDYSAKILGYPEQFVEYVVYELQNNIGNCRPIYNLWNEATKTLCTGLVRSFNGVWFTLGWCVFFLMPALIFGVKLAKHFRRGTEAKHFGSRYMNDTYDVLDLNMRSSDSVALNLQQRGSVLTADNKAMAVD